MLAALGGGCQLPIAAYAKYGSGKLRLMGVVASPEGTRVIRARASGKPDGPESLGKRVAEELFSQGAGEMLSQPELDIK